MGDFENANAVAILSAGSNPRWSEQTSLDTSTVPPTFDATDVTGAPDAASSGLALPTNSGVGALRTLVALDIRVLAKSHDPDISDTAEVHRRSARFNVNNFVASSEYTVTIDANVVTTVNQPYADVAAAIQEVADAITADVAGAGAVVTAVAIDADDDGNVDTMLLQGKAEADYVIDTISASGAGTVTCIADPAGADLRVYTAQGGVNNTANPRQPGWRKPNDGDFASIDYTGFDERLDTSGKSRLYLEVLNVVGVVSGAGDDAAITYAYRAWIGPGIKVGDQ